MIERQQPKARGTRAQKPPKERGKGELSRPYGPRRQLSRRRFAEGLDATRYTLPLDLQAMTRKLRLQSTMESPAGSLPMQRAIARRAGQLTNDRTTTAKGREPLTARTTDGADSAVHTFASLGEIEDRARHATRAALASMQLMGKHHAGTEGAFERAASKDTIAAVRLTASPFQAKCGFSV